MQSLNKLWILHQCIAGANGCRPETAPPRPFRRWEVFPERTDYLFLPFLRANELVRVYRGNVNPRKRNTNSGSGTPSTNVLLPKVCNQILHCPVKVTSSKTKPRRLSRAGFLKAEVRNSSSNNHITKTEFRCRHCPSNTYYHEPLRIEISNHGVSKFICRHVPLVCTAGEGD